MKQGSLFENTDTKNADRVYLGSGCTLEFVGRRKEKAILYRNGVHMKVVDLSDRTAKRLFVVEMIKVTRLVKARAVANSASYIRISELVGIKRGSSRINVIFPLFENQHFIYLRRSMVVTTWIYSDLTEMSVAVPPNP
nr:hypothetical protein GZ18F2_16 [uncultured archaeon GZfos18F2]